MKKMIAIVLLCVSGVASAACPMTMPYGCHSGYNGKMVCGCGR